ncbi:MAG: tetratricopeptide repeat protein, partial [Saprospiraceae bacterium]
KRKQVQDSISALQRSRDKWEKTSKTSSKSLLNAASANLRLGEAEKAETLAKEAIKRNPKNTDALQILVDAHLQQGDTIKAVQTVKRAVEAGVDLKGIRLSTSIKLPTLGGGQ